MDATSSGRKSPRFIRYAPSYDVQYCNVYAVLGLNRAGFLVMRP